MEPLAFLPSKSFPFFFVSLFSSPYSLPDSSGVEMITSGVPKVVDVLTEGKEIIRVSSDDEIGKVIKVLGENGIYSCPVVRKDGLAAGFVDWLDILGHLIHVVSESKQSRVTPASRSLTTDDFAMIMERADEFSLRTVESRRLANASTKNPWKSVKATDSVQKALNVLCQYHHVAVEDSGKLINICSQMDVLRWLNNDPERMGPDGRKTLQGLQLHRKRVICVRATDLAVDAFFNIYNHGVSGAGVVDEQGKLVGCLSATDLKQIAEDYDFTQLLKPVKDYLGDDATAPIALHAFDTLRDVVSKLVSTRVHRVFIVGPGGYPLGVVSCTDVLRVFQAEEGESKEGEEKKKKKKKKKDKDKKKESSGKNKGDKDKKKKKKK